MEMVKLTGKDEVCLDGSPAVFYFRKGTGSGSHKYFILYEGGGWCESEADCAGRARTHLGSSTGYAEKLDTRIQSHGRGVPTAGYFSTLESANPMMHNWNFVLMKCKPSSP